ncbi:MAG: cephalosporin-C deacetylase-like acetyl esterase [Pirellulaceae bacterium]|jgi:cephalosporin-C deacetylase-like acetyl esterase
MCRAINCRPVSRSIARCALSCAAWLVCVSTLAADDSWWQVLPGTEESVGKNPVRRYLHREAEVVLQRRDAVLESIKTPEQIANYQTDLREFFWKQLGGRPQQTPLNARVTSKHTGERFRVENLIYESRPQFFVTANLYLPTTPAPYPAVIIPCGHTSNGKASSGYQRMGMLLARNGIAALCYDPIGQGERYQLLDGEGKPRQKSTNEHTMVGIGSALVGWNTATYRVVDGVRSLDYLCGRKDVDATKLGCAGQSGGGTLTEYLMALDERIVAAAPACSVATWRRRLLTIGPGDAEQNIAGQLARGLDHGDFTIIRAPRPTLICSATDDFVDIQGAWDVHREGKRIYTRLGFPERVDLVEVDGKHGYPSAMRVAVARWMLRWLVGIDRLVEEQEVSTLTAEQIQCTPAGQVLLLPNAKSVMELNAGRNRQLAELRAKVWDADPKGVAVEQVRKLIAVSTLAELPATTSKKIGTLARSGYRIDKYVLTGENDIPLPGLMFVPEEHEGNPILYLNGLGKHVDAQEGGEIEKLVRAGRIVFAVDLSGTGETGGGETGQWGGDWDNIFVAYMMDRPIVGLRTEDIWRSTQFLAEQSKSSAVDVIARQVASVPALHAVALERQLYGKVDIQLPFNSWSEMLEKPTIKGQLVHLVHGALESYDLSDLTELAK